MTLTVDVQEAAAMMKVHPRTVLLLIDDGSIPAAKVGKSWVMLTKDVLGHVERSIVQQTAARMRRPAKSPKARRQIAAPQVGVAHQHAV